MSDDTNPDADMESAFNYLNGGTASQIRNNVSNVANDNPDQAAQYQHLARFTNQPIQTVQNNPDGIKQQAAAKAVDADNIAQNNPHTANFLSNPDTAAISHDDIANLVASENAAKSVGATTALGRIVGAGLGAVKGTFDTQDNPPGFSPEDYEAMGLNEKPQGVLGIIKQIPANLASGGAGLVDLAMRTLSAPFSGGAAAIVQAAREMGMSDTGAGMLDRDIQGMFQNEMGRIGQHIPSVEGFDPVAAKMQDSVRKANEAQSAARELQTLNDTVTASKVRARGIDSFSNFIKDAAQDGPVKDLYINAQTFAQEAGDKLPALLDALPQVREQFQNAAAMGGDVRIPVEDFASKIAGSDIAPNLIQHLKTEPDGFSQVEAQKFMDTQGESLKADVQKVLSEKQGDDAFKQSQQNVEDTISDQLKSVNRFTPQVNKQYASLLSNFYASTAARLGITPEEMAARYPLNITAQDIGEGFNQKADPKDAAFVPIERGKTGHLGARLNFEQIKGGSPDTKDEYTISPAKYAKGNTLIETPSADGWKGRAARLASALNGKFTGREGGYILSPSAAEKFQRLHNAGWDAGYMTGEFEPPKTLKQNIAAQDLGEGFNQKYSNVTAQATGHAVGGFHAVDADTGEIIRGAKWKRGDMSPRFATEDKAIAWGAKQTKAQDIGEGFNQSIKPPEGLKPFIDLAKTASDGKDFVSKARDIHGVSPEISDWFHKRYAGGEEFVDMNNAAQKFIDEVKSGAFNQKSNPAFDKWFEGSKVVDEKGKPLTVYHGTQSDFDTFDAQRQGESVSKSDIGFFFTNNPEDASAHSQADWWRDNPQPNVKPSYLNIKNPEVINNIGEPARWYDTNGREAVKKAIAEGKDGLIIGSGDHKLYVAFDPKQIKSKFNSGSFDPNDPSTLKQNNLGSYNPASPTIGLMNGANLSTFLHESGHFFLDTLSRIAANDEAPPEIKDDFAKLMNWFGVKDVAEWQGKSLDEQRPFHEQFARAFENYLMEGKAPSLELQPIFQRFRGWLLNVYRSAKDFLTLHPEAGKLDDETRGVMDRMLATSKDIKTAETARSITPIFKTAEDAKMTPEEFQQYKDQDIRGAQDAITELDTRRLRDMQWLDNAKNDAIRKLQAEAKDKRDAIRADVTKEVTREPVYAAERYIRRGEGPDGEKALGNTKLNSDAMRELGYPDEFIQKMSQGGKYGLVSPKGVHPDALAEQLGFSSGHDLIDSLDNAEPIREKIAALTDQRMLEQHGDLTDPRAISRAADKAVYNEARNKIVATELKALNKQLGNKQILTQAAKQFAAEMVNKENASKLNPNLYMANAARLGREAEEAFSKGKLQDAALAKRNQLINQYAVKAAFEAQKTMRDVLTLARKLDNAAYREKIPGQYLEQIDGLLGRYDLRQNPSPDPNRAQVNLSKWLEAQREAGFEPAVADWLASDPRKISFKDMSVEEMKGLGDAVKSMLHMAREAKKVTIAGQQLALDDVVKQLSEPLKERGEKFTKEELLNPPQKGVDSFLKVALYKMGSALRLSVADLKPQEFKRNAYDLHELEGPFGKYLFEPMFERNYWKLDRLRENSEFFKAWGAKLGDDWQKSLYNLVTNRTLLDPDLSTPDKPVFMKMTRAKLLSMMAHVGNESNFDKLTRGYNWQGADVMNFIHENATKEDWDAVQAQGKIFEKYWPEIEAMSRRLGGVPPDKIELRPIKTKFGTYEGWYAPIDYDPIRSKLSAKYGDVMADPTEQIGKEQNYRATTTFNGSMQNRQAGYTDRVNLDFHGFESRLKDTVHDLAYREQLIDANKILSNKDFRSAFTQAYGREEFNGLTNWLRGIRDMNSSDPQNKGFEKFMQYSRQGIVSTGIAYRVSTVLKHGSSAALKSLGYLSDGPGMKYFASRAARMATGNAMQDIADAREKFPEIRTRLLQMDRDYKEGIASMYEKEDWRAKNERFGHAMVAWSDALTAVPTAWAAYDRAIHEGLPENQGGTGKPMTEAQAVAYANKVVREAHGTALESARSNFLQAKGVKGLFGTIYGFMNNTFGQLTDIADKVAAKNSNFTSSPVAAARLMATLVIPAVVAKMVQGNDKSDPWYAWGAKAIAGEVAGTVPFVREAWSSIEYAKNDVDTVGPLRIIQDVVNSARDAYGETQGKQTRGVSDFSNAVGELFHIGGLGQLGKSLQYLRDVHNGKQQPKDALDVVKGVTVGAPPKK